jgi:hypothetical protein
VIRMGIATHVSHVLAALFLSTTTLWIRHAYK